MISCLALCKALVKQIYYWGKPTCKQVGAVECPGGQAEGLFKVLGGSSLHKEVVYIRKNITFDLNLNS